MILKNEPCVLQLTQYSPYMSLGTSSGFNVKILQPSPANRMYERESSWGTVYSPYTAAS